MRSTISRHVRNTWRNVVYFFNTQNWQQVNLQTFRKFSTFHFYIVCHLISSGRRLQEFFMARENCFTSQNRSETWWSLNTGITANTCRLSLLEGVHSVALIVCTHEKWQKLLCNEGKNRARGVQTLAPFLPLHYWPMMTWSMCESRIGGFGHLQKLLETGSSNSMS